MLSFPFPASSLDVKNSEQERNNAVCVHRVKHEALVLLSLEQALAHTESDQSGHYEIQNMNQILKKYHLSIPLLVQECQLRVQDHHCDGHGTEEQHRKNKGLEEAEI